MTRTTVTVGGLIAMCPIERKNGPLIFLSCLAKETGLVCVLFFEVWFLFSVHCACLKFACQSIRIVFVLSEFKGAAQIFCFCISSVKSKDVVCLLSG